MGRNARERSKSVGDVISELNIIREQLRHPNIVRYYKTFEESESENFDTDFSVTNSKTD